jgi:hypothetical protein
MTRNGTEIGLAARWRRHHSSHRSEQISETAKGVREADLERAEQAHGLGGISQSARKLRLGSACEARTAGIELASTATNNISIVTMP